MNKHLFNALKIKTFLLIALFLAFSNYASAQLVSLSVSNETIGQVLKEITRQTGLNVAYSKQVVDVSRKISLNLSNVEVSEVLSKIVAGSSLAYEIKDGNIYLFPQSSSTNGLTQVKKKITGTIVDADKMSIIGASILEGGTQNGTLSDLDGNFTLTVGENATLLISYIGYQKQEIKVGNQTIFNIRMEEDRQMLDEVVVVGYGTMKKRDLTGAVSSVKMSDMPVTTVSSVSQVLAGKAAGFQVSTLSAQPGGGSSFRIRGAASPTAGMNEPLVIIDGFPVSTPADSDNGGINGGKYKAGRTDNILSSINPNDIESIEILKDASSSAIYGARAGNGVIIITTKRGKTGAPVVTYSSTASVQSMSKTYDILNAHDFMIQSNRYAKENWLRTNKIAPYGTNPESSALTYVPYYTDSQIANPVNDTRWFDEVTRTGFQTQQNISVSGGTEGTQYMVSGNYFNQKGVIKNNDISRYSIRMNLDQKLSKYFKGGVNFTISRNVYDNVPLGSGQNENASLLVSAAQFNPLLPIRNENGDYVLNTEAAFLPNPVSLLEITDITTKERMLAVAYVEFEPLKNLKFKANFGIDRNYQKRKSYLPKTTLYGQKTGGQAALNQNDRSDYLAEYTGTYTRSFGDHNLTALLGYSYQKFVYEGMDMSNNQFLIDGFLYNNMGAGAAAKPSVGSSGGSDEMASFFGRVNYSYKDRYLLTATLRADGASNFAPDNRWGYFPSVSVGWRFLDESFLAPLQSILSNGKLRVSYGETGRSNIGNRAISYYAVGYNNTFGDAESQGVYLEQIGNPSLKWETTGEWNFGLDLGFLDNRINLTAEYFSRVVSDLLQQRSLQSYNEVSTIWANVGKTQSKGFELTIGTKNLSTKDFSWTTDLTFSFYRDKWKERDSYWKPSAYSIYNAPIRGTYGYLSDGIIQTDETVSHMPGSIPGQIKIKDIDSFKYNSDGSIQVDERGFPIKTGQPDGKLDDADKVFYGSSDPGYLAGLNNTFKWKQFDLNIYLYGQFNKTNYGSYKDLWLTGSAGMTGIANMYRGYNMPVTAKEVWSHDNPGAPRPGFFQDRSSFGVADFFKQDASFVRCRNITLGYTFPVNPDNKFFSNLRVYADVNNPFVITSYKGLDPETDDSVWAYPNVTSFSLGLDITF